MCRLSHKNAAAALAFIFSAILLSACSSFNGQVYVDANDSSQHSDQPEPAIEGNDTSSKTVAPGSNNLSDQKKGEIELVVGAKYQKYSQFQSAVWIAHALAKIHCEDRYPQLSFENEHCAIKAALDIWRELKKKEKISDDYFDELMAIRRAGFLREYVWVYLKQDYWFKPDELLLDKFESWRSHHLKDHQPNLDPEIVAVQTEDKIKPRFQPSSFNSGYPEQIENFHYISEGLYFPSELGKSARYQLDKHSLQRGYADIYIYDIPKEQRQTERKSLTLATASQSKSEILSMLEKGQYHDFSTVLEQSLESTASHTLFARGVYSFTINHAKYFSALYLALSGDKVFKVRITYPYNQHYQNSDHFKTFVFELFEKIMR